jgi:hypothetical protein
MFCIKLSISFYKIWNVSKGKLQNKRDTKIHPKMNAQSVLHAKTRSAYNFAYQTDFRMGET